MYNISKQQLVTSCAKKSIFHQELCEALIYIKVNTNDMRSNFYNELHKNRKNLVNNTSVLSNEQYNELIEIILELKAGSKKKQPKDFRLIKRQVIHVT